MSYDNINREPCRKTGLPFCRGLEGDRIGRISSRAVDAFWAASWACERGGQDMQVHGREPPGVDDEILGWCAVPTDTEALLASRLTE